VSLTVKENTFGGSKKYKNSKWQMAMMAVMAANVARSSEK
jgi:hypothetical protein